MKRRLFSLLLIITMVVSINLAGCGKKDDVATDAPKQKEAESGTVTDKDDVATDAPKQKEAKIGMVTDSGTIDDKSFNQGTWEGIQLYKDHSGSETQYIKPDGESKTDYLKAINDLVDSEYEILVTPGFKFQEAIYEAQEKYPEVKFVLIDGIPIPSANDYANAKVGDNTVSIFFAEEEGGFLAGLASALESKTGKVGYIGGMEIPPVQKYGWGFVAGVAYANEAFGTDVTVQEYIYQGTFNEIEAGKALAGTMYDQGIDIIFPAAGSVNIGVINEGKERTKGGSKVFVIGCDADQYPYGVYEGEKSVILTSALKRVGYAAYEHVRLFTEGEFPGGQTIVMNVENQGIGLPEKNPNLPDESYKKITEIMDKMKSGDVTVPATLEDLNQFLADHNYTTPEGVKY